MFINIEARISHGFSCHAIPILIQYSLELLLHKNAIYIFDWKQIKIGEGGVGGWNHKKTLKSTKSSQKCKGHD